MRKKHAILVAIFVLSLSTDLHSQVLKTDTVNKWYLPTHISFQFAGNIGMFSLGLSWSLLKSNIELAYSIGYVPKSDAGTDIYIMAMKGNYIPELDINIRKITIKPLLVGTVLTYTFGDRYNKFQNNSNSFNEYYSWLGDYRLGLTYGAEVYTLFSKKNIKKLSVYFEASFWDLYIYSLIWNYNYSYLNLWDISTFGLGIKMFFR